MISLKYGKTMTNTGNVDPDQTRSILFARACLSEDLARIHYYNTKWQQSLEQTSKILKSYPLKTCPNPGNLNEFPQDKHLMMSMQYFFSYFLYKSICCGYLFELP